MTYFIRFHNTSAYIFVKSSCISELKYKLKKLVPDMFIKRIEVFNNEDYNLYINLQKS